jgi:hypothetical protein
MVVGVVNAAAMVFFAVALCWRVDRIRRERAGLQPLAMTVAVATMTLAFVVTNPHLREWLDTTLFTGAGRVFFYCLLAIGVAALVVVFFFGSAEEGRQRRAGMEAIPLVIAMIGLNVAMLATPTPLRTRGVSEWTVQHVGFALFFVIAGTYLVYALGACVLSIGRYVGLADGYLRHSLIALQAGLAMVGIGSLIQTLFVVSAGLNLFSLPILLKIAAVVSSIGAVLFLLGISYPMLRARWLKFRYDIRHRRHYRELETLWELTTSALPEVVLPPRSGDSVGGSINLMYQRRVIEVRDAVLQLSPYLPDDFDSRPLAEQAGLMREAVDTYREAGGSSGAVREVLSGVDDDLDADAEPLRRLSRELGRGLSAPSKLRHSAA